MAGTSNIGFWTNSDFMAILVAIDLFIRAVIPQWDTKSYDKH